MREISKSLVFIACLDNTPGYRQGLRAKGSSAVLPFPGGAHGSAGWGHGGRWARGVTQPASGEQAVLIFPLLLSCRWMSLLFQKSEINSREFLGNRGFWICHAYESAESTGKWGFFFCTWSHILTETKRKRKKKRERDLRVCGDQSWVLCYRNFPFQTQTTYSGMWAKKGRERLQEGLKK